MGPGAFHYQVAESWKLLQELELGDTRNVDPYYGNEKAATYRNLDYVDIWESLYINELFDICLSDSALLQFRFDYDDCCVDSYAYYECPMRADSYEDFIWNTYGVRYVDVYESYRREYELYLETCPRKETVTPIRYDVDYSSYDAGVHPACHFHIGFDSEMRLGTRRVLQPLSFCLFVLRHCYPQKWRRVQKQDYRQYVREELEEVGDEYWNIPDEEYEVYLF